MLVIGIGLLGRFVFVLISCVVVCRNDSVLCVLFCCK